MIVERNPKAVISETRCISRRTLAAAFPFLTKGRKRKREIVGMNVDLGSYVLERESLEMKQRCFPVLGNKYHLTCSNERVRRASSFVPLQPPGLGGRAESLPAAIC